MIKREYPGGFCGAGSFTHPGGFDQSGLEGICMNLKIALDALEEHVETSREMLIVGGGANSAFWRGLFADILIKWSLNPIWARMPGLLARL